jgi:hypothetical protein
MAAQIASAAASLCVQRAGAQPSIPRRIEIDTVHPLPSAFQLYSVQSAEAVG